PLLRALMWQTSAGTTGPAVPQRWGGGVYPLPATTLLDASVALDDADVAELARHFGGKLPIELGGRLSLSAKLSIPVSDSDDLRAYRLEGQVSAPRLSVAGVAFEQVSARVGYADGLFRLERLTGCMPRSRSPGGPGRFDGTLQMQLAPRGELAFDL